MANEPKVKIDLYKIIMFWRNIGKKYDAIKADPEKAEKDVSLGVQSLCMSIGGIIMTLAFAYFAYKCFTWTGDVTLSTGVNGIGGFFAIIGGAICAVISVASYIYLVLASIIYASYQRKLNKKKIGIIAYIVSLLLSIATIVTVVVFVLIQIPAFN